MTSSKHILKIVDLMIHELEDRIADFILEQPDLKKLAAIVENGEIKVSAEAVTIV